MTGYSQNSLFSLMQEATDGNASAQFNIGLMYDTGNGVPQDSREAIKWYTKAAEQEDDSAQYNLGWMYDTGKGIPQDYKEAVKWYTKAAEQGHAKAQHNLGLSYFNAEGVPEDYVTGYKWLVLAAVSGDSNSVKLRNIMKNRMTQEQIAEAQRLAKEFKPNTASSVTKEPFSNTPDKLMGSRPRSAATGFFITTDGLIVTANHAVEGSTQVSVLTADGEKKARVVKRDIANDLALLKVEQGSYIPLTIKSSSTVKLGQDVFTLGFPNIVIQGFEPKFTKGSISSLAGIGDDPRYFQISVPVQPGNSGGPLIDSMGNVVGVVTAKLPDIETLVATGQLPQNVSYAVRSSLVLSLLETIPDASEKLKSPNTKEVDQTKIVEETKQSVVLVLSY